MLGVLSKKKDMNLKKQIKYLFIPLFIIIFVNFTSIKVFSENNIDHYSINKSESLIQDQISHVHYHYKWYNAWLGLTNLNGWFFNNKTVYIEYEVFTALENRSYLKPFPNEFDYYLNDEINDWDDIISSISSINNWDYSTWYSDEKWCDAGGFEHNLGINYDGSIYQHSSKYLVNDDSCSGKRVTPSDSNVISAMNYYQQKLFDLVEKYDLSGPNPKINGKNSSKTSFGLDIGLLFGILLIIYYKRKRIS
jgi:hypothetical protein